LIGFYREGTTAKLSILTHSDFGANMVATTTLNPTGFYASLVKTEPEAALLLLNEGASPNRVVKIYKITTTSSSITITPFVSNLLNNGSIYTSKISSVFFFNYDKIFITIGTSPSPFPVKSILLAADVKIINTENEKVFGLANNNANAGQVVKVYVNK
jgi:hypothetical protein